MNTRYTEQYLQVILVLQQGILIQIEIKTNVKIIVRMGKNISDKFFISEVCAHDLSYIRNQYLKNLTESHNCLDQHSLIIH